MATGSGGTQLSKRVRYTPSETAVFVNAPRAGHAASSGTREHLNSTLPPTDVNAQTRFRYLTTNGSDDGAPYLKAPP